MNSYFPVEVQILLECARFRGARIDYLEQLVRKVDSNRLVSFAFAHGLIPLCYQQISLLDSERALTLRERLEHRWLTNICAADRLSQELVDLLDVFHARDIPVIPFKGPVLADSAYKEVGLRQVGDIDLLIRPRDFGAVMSLLRESGFLPVRTFSPLQQRHYVKTDCALYFRCPDRGVLLDVQWRFSPDYVPVRFDYMRWFDRPERSVFHGREIMTVPREDLLLYLIYHAALHMWSRVVHMADVIKHLESSDSWDWALLSRRAEVSGLGNVLPSGLALCSDLLAWPTPEEVRVSAGRKKWIGEWKIGIKKRLAASGGMQPGTLRTLFFRLSMMASNRGRFRYAFGRAVLPSASDWSFLGLPDRLYPLYYPLRLARLAWVALSLPGKAVYRRLSRRRASAPDIGETSPAGFE